MIRSATQGGMKWKIKDKENDRCIISDCGQYRISRYRHGELDLFLVYHGSKEIGDAPDGNKARKIAQQHSERSTA